MGRTLIKDLIHQAITVCNADYQVSINNMHTEFHQIRRITKNDVTRILERYSKKTLGEDLDPYLTSVRKQPKINQNTKTP
jgi:hypothetical protein